MITSLVEFLFRNNHCGRIKRTSKGLNPIHNCLTGGRQKRSRRCEACDIQKYFIHTYMHFIECISIRVLQWSMRITCNNDWRLYRRPICKMQIIMYRNIYITIKPKQEVTFYRLYYFMRNFCNLIDLEHWYFSLIWNTTCENYKAFAGSSIKK